MYQSIVFRSGSTIWITDKEASYLYFRLLNGEKFVDVPRLSQVFNSDTIAYVGVNSIFLNEKVKGGEFSFTPSAIYAKIDDKEFIFDKGWKKTKDVFAEGKTFDEHIGDQTVERGNADPVNNVKAEVIDPTKDTSVIDPNAK